MHNVDLSDFKPVEFSYGKVHTQGGCLKKCEPMTTTKGGKEN